MRAALDVLKSEAVGEGGRRIAVIGDMLELGSHAASLHAELADAVEAAGVERVYMAGEEMKALDDVLENRVPREWHDSVDELLESLLKEAHAGDVIMVKASKSIGFGPLVERIIARLQPEPGDGAPSQNPPTVSSGADA
jgi:UDP-N-acetylmuramoyl-tripeptide--D-alanyl-D-alanine ligase